MGQEAATPHNPHTWYAYIDNEEVLEALQEVKVSAPEVAIKIARGGINAAIEEQKQRASGAKLVIDVTTVDNPLAKVEELAEYCYAGTYGVIIGNNDTIEFYRELMDIGVDDYLVIPVTRNGLYNALISAEKRGIAAESTMSKKIVVTGSRPGVGASTCAVNLACLLSDNLGLKTCLVDWDYYFGSDMLALNMETNQGLLETIQYKDRLDEALISRLAVPRGDNLVVLSAQAELDDAIAHSANDIVMVGEALRSMFDVTLFDVPHSPEYVQAILHTQADTLVLVTDLSITGIRDTARILEKSNIEEAHTQVKIVVIREKLIAGEQFSMSQFENKVGRSADYVLYRDNKNTLAALNHGKPLAETNPKHPIIQALAEIVMPFSIKEVRSAKRSSWLGGVFKGKVK